MFRMIRLGVLALAGYGAYTLYEKYGQQLPKLGAPLQEFTERTADATEAAADRISSATGDATSAMKASVNEVERAATDARDEAIRTLHESPTTSKPG